MEDNKEEVPSPAGGNNADGLKSGPVNKPDNNLGGLEIVGINLLVLAVYTVLCKIEASEGGIVYDLLLVGVHVFVCIIMAIVRKSWIWLLSALMVLVIGFSTCVAGARIFGSMQ
jgi:hypothetical protein